MPYPKRSPLAPLGPQTSRVNVFRQPAARETSPDQADTPFLEPRQLQDLKIQRNSHSEESLPYLKNVSRNGDNSRYVIACGAGIPPF
jgi:hypothetical protein